MILIKTLKHSEFIVFFLKLMDKMAI